jgi:mRNA interferase MazF
MVGEVDILSRGGVYLGRFGPSKAAEIGKIRPVVILNAQKILNAAPPVVFICPLSSQSHVNFSSLHAQLPPRDNLHVTSFALVEHSRSITIRRLIYPRLAQLTDGELALILHLLNRLVGN